ncbi:type I restriction-modification system subunit M [Thermogemmatispora onikobensis]|uniref:type I restriction-modification system subunit M n=1 Tax=Thermogemmatispora onikobensis TaxID=732234 RepID=UPI000B1F9539|nr:class I SAM-dependent DNA methyltransferase [Thermogemmatispora onikobensis]
MPRKKNGKPGNKGNGYQVDPQMAQNPVLPLALRSNEHLTIAELEQWLWDAACAIRGATDAPKFKDFILPLVFYKRLSDVFDDECADWSKHFGDEAVAQQFIEEDHRQALLEGRRPMVRFLIPAAYRWEQLRNHGLAGLGEFVSEAMQQVAKLNPALDGVINVRDYNERQGGQRTLDDERLAALIEVISRHRLGLRNAEPDVLGRAYEYLLRKFAEGQGQSAGEFYTPKEVGWLIASLLDPRPRSTIYDPACGSGGLLIKARLYFEEHHPEERSKAPRLFGQELNPVTLAIAKMNMFLHDYTDALLLPGDTLRRPGFVAEGAGLRRFDYAVANPMWNQDGYDDEFYDHDPYGRCQGFGKPPAHSADWGWIEHIYASLNEQGQAAVVLDTGAVSRGSGSKNSNREREIRACFVERDLIEAVILLPDNLFYNTSAPGIVLLLRRQKPEERRNQLLLVNASQLFVKEKPKNVLSEEGIAAITEVYRAWESRPRLSRVITLEEARATDYNLSPSQFVDTTPAASYRPLPEILADLARVRAQREEAERELERLLSKLSIKQAPIEHGW